MYTYIGDCNIVKICFTHVRSGDVVRCGPQFSDMGAATTQLSAAVTWWSACGWQRGDVVAIAQLSTVVTWHYGGQVSAVATRMSGQRQRVGTARAHTCTRWVR